VKLLHAIYSSPTELLRKAEDDGVELVNAVQQQDKAKARAALFNFAVTTYHIWDWVKASRPDLVAKVKHPLSTYESLAACRDLANASKHAIITVTRGPYKKHPPIVQDVAVSAVASSPPGTSTEPVVAYTLVGQQTATTRWRLKVQLASGRRLAIEDLASEALAAWKDYFGKHSIA
jgi:hypothetical protein